MTWTADSSTTDPNWGGQTDTDDLAWAQLTAVTEQNDVDFRLKAREEFPMKAMSDRPLKALTSVISTP